MFDSSWKYIKLKFIEVIFFNVSLFLLNVFICCFNSQEIQDKVLHPEKAEEAKLKARYPHLGNKPGGSDLLRKRLQKGVSHF